MHVWFMCVTWERFECDVGREAMDIEKEDELVVFFVMKNAIVRGQGWEIIKFSICLVAMPCVVITLATLELRNMLVRMCCHFPFCFFHFSFVLFSYVIPCLCLTWWGKWLSWLRLMSPNSHDLSSTLEGHVFFLGVSEFDFIIRVFISLCVIGCHALID